MTRQADNIHTETVVLLHSLGTDHQLWAAQIPALDAHFQVLTPDSLGHGGKPSKGKINLSAWVKDIDALIAPLEQPVHLVGLSMGGIQAMAYAARHPHKVRSLVLANTFASLDQDAAENKIRSIHEAIGTQGMDQYAEQYLLDTLTTEIDPQVRTRLRTAISGVTADDYLRSSEATFRANLVSQLTAITAPTLVMIGDGDKKTPLPLSETLVEHIPDARLAIVPGAGHLSNIDAPDAFNDLLLGFIAARRSTVASS